MNKRRRTSSVASRGTEDDPDDVLPEPTKRRRKLDPVNLVVPSKIPLTNLTNLSFSLSSFRLFFFFLNR